MFRSTCAHFQILQRHQMLKKKYDDQKLLNGRVLKLLAVKDEKIQSLENKIKSIESKANNFDKYIGVFTKQQLTKLRQVSANSRGDRSFVRMMLENLIENGHRNILNATVATLDAEVYEVMGELFEQRIEQSASSPFDYSNRNNVERFRRQVADAICYIKSKQGQPKNICRYEITMDGDEICLTEK